MADKLVSSMDLKSLLFFVDYYKDRNVGGGGSIDYELFASFLQSRVDFVVSPKMIEDGFLSINEGHHRPPNVLEYLKFMCSVGFKDLLYPLIQDIELGEFGITQETNIRDGQALAMFHLMDVDGDAMVNEEEFINSSLLTYEIWGIEKIPSVVDVKVGFKLSKHNKGGKISRGPFLTVVRDILGFYGK